MLDAGGAPHCTHAPAAREPPRGRAHAFARAYTELGCFLLQRTSFCHGGGEGWGAVAEVLIGCKVFCPDAMCTYGRMQGWRTSMEDAHCAELNVDGQGSSFFGVYDGSHCSPRSAAWQPASRACSNAVG